MTDWSHLKSITPMLSFPHVPEYAPFPIVTEIPVPEGVSSWYDKSDVDASSLELSAPHVWHTPTSSPHTDDVSGSHTAIVYV